MRRRTRHLIAQVDRQLVDIQEQLERITHIADALMRLADDEERNARPV